MGRTVVDDRFRTAVTAAGTAALAVILQIAGEGEGDHLLDLRTEIRFGLFRIDHVTNIINSCEDTNRG